MPAVKRIQKHLPDCSNLSRCWPRIQVCIQGSGVHRLGVGPNSGSTRHPWCRRRNILCQRFWSCRPWAKRVWKCCVFLLANGRLNAICLPFAGQNNIFWHFVIFSDKNGKIQKKCKKIQKIQKKYTLKRVHQHLCATLICTNRHYINSAWCLCLQSGSVHLFFPHFKSLAFSSWCYY